MKGYKHIVTMGSNPSDYPTEITGVTSVIEEYEKDGWHLHIR